MPLTSAQICSRAVSQAKPGTPASQASAVAGQYLNMVLADLCDTYDFEVARNDYVFNFNPSLVSTTQFPNNTAGSGPYPLPDDYLRCQKDEFIWYLNGVPYRMIACDLSEYDLQVQQAGMQSYPAIFATSLNSSPPVAIIWPPASGSYQALIRYQCKMDDIGSGNTKQTPLWNPGLVAPESSTVVPWFPNQTYLITRVAGELMKESSDARWKDFLGDGSAGAQGILNRYLKLKDDSSDRAKTVKLDNRRFGPRYTSLPPTKSTGW